MRYISTRAQTEPRTFVQAIIEGLARDGGLFVPETLPDFSTQLEQLSSLSYKELALSIFQPFVGGEIKTEELESLIEKSYSTFRTEEVTPLSFVDRLGILELYHGPTLAFKDVALQFLGNLFELVLSRSDDHLTILGATSGDTGSAAIHGVRGKENIHIFMLHPKGRISPIQRKQMTTVLDDNVINIAIKGTFDDAQRMVKAIFNDLHFRDRYALGAVNSINWARVMAQIVYYFYAAFRYMDHYKADKVVFSVPTGNFGDIYAGYLAKKMGLPIDKLILATNENDILFRAINSGIYKISTVHSTLSPSMDIQIASNFERFVFDVCKKDGSAVKEKMDQLNDNHQFTLSAEEHAKAQESFIPVRVDTATTLSTMKRFYQKDVVLDPHTAVGVAAALACGFENSIALATAHPVKFGDAVQQATGHEPKLPESLQGILERPERCIEAENDQKAVQSIIETVL